jgi:WD40 repeat protein/DNA-binding SARP family transcriptional activator
MGLDVRLLGQFNLQFAGQEIVIPSRPAQSLFAFLVLNAGASHRRERLAGLLWPDTSEAHARGYLRKALWLIRRSFHGAAVPWQSYLHVDEIAIAFDRNADYWLDAELITAHQELETWSIGELMAAVATFRGELLPGFYDEWIVLERERVHVCFDQRMRCLLERLVEEGCWEEVVEWGERWIALGHTPEPAYRALMIAHAGVGDLVGVTAVYRRCEEALLRELGVRPSRALEDTYHRLSRREAPAEEVAEESRERWGAYEQPPLPGEPPYKGLAFFDVADAGLFFGREKLAARLAEHLRKHTLLAVVGASGSGKSSLLRAGLAPAFRQRAASGEGWLVTVLTPTDHPLRALAAAVGEGGAAGAPALREALAENPHCLSDSLKKQVAGRAAAGVLLIVDQFEELFTLCRDEAERKAFIDHLLVAAAPDGAIGPIRVVIGLRADFYAHCADYPRLAHLLARNQEYVTPMSPEELRRAIEEPARRNGWAFQPGLVDLLMRETRDEPGALPLLSHVLLESWRRRSGPAMTLKGYAESGGVRGAIAKTAQQVYYQRLTAEQQALARNIFLRLTDLGEETQATRRRAEIAELVLSPGSLSAVQEVLGILAEARLVTLGEHTAEVAHEALIREWPVLRQWLSEDRQGLLLHRHLTDAAQEWEAMGQDEGELYRGARLEQALSWASANRERLNPLETAFLAASRGLAERRAAEREAERQRELEAARRLAEAEKKRADEQLAAAQHLRRRAMWLGAVMGLALLLALAAVWAWRQAGAEAARSRSLLLANAAETANVAGRSDLALALALAAADLEPPPDETLRVLRSIATGPGTMAVLSGHERDVRAAALSPDQALALSGSCARVDDQARCLAGELILWDLEAKRELRRWEGHAGGLSAVAFTQDGASAVAGADDGSLILWNVATGAAIREFRGHSGRVSSLSLGGDRLTLFTGSDDGMVVLWELGSGALIRRFAGNTAPVSDIDVDGSGSRLVAGIADGTLILWDVESGVIVRSIDGHSKVNEVALSADGSQILSTGEDLKIRLWDSETGELVQEQDLICRPDTLAWSEDGRTAIISCESIIFLWDVPAWQEVGRFLGHTGYIEALEISRDGRLALSAATDGTVRLWSLEAQLSYQMTDTGMPMVSALAAHPDGRRLLLGSPEVYAWDAAERQLGRPYRGFVGVVPPGAVAISPDGRYVSAAGGALPPDDVRSLVIWEAESGEVACRLEGHATTLRALAFSPDSRTLLAGSLNQERLGDLILWDAESCQMLRRFETTHEISSIAFSADGRQAITGQAYSPVVTLWDVSSGREVRRFVTDVYPERSSILDVAFGPNDQTILGSGSESLYMWDVESGEIVRRYRGHSGLIYSQDVSPAGEDIVSSSEPGEVILWDLKSGEELYRLLAHQQNVYSAVFSVDGKRVFSIDTAGVLVEWKVAEMSPGELRDWIAANRYVRELTCAERAQYDVQQLCRAGETTATP